MFTSRTRNMRLRVFKVLCPLILCFGSLQAQFPNPSLLNTGTNASGTGIVPLLSNDLSWKAAMTNSLGPYVPAVVVGTYPGWSPSPFANATWICFPHTCSVSPADHSCDALYLNEFYKLTFNLPALNCGQSVSTPSAYCLSLDFMADNCVRQIFVNGVSSYLDTSPNPAGNWGFLINNKVTVSLCNNWVAGTNTILVHVISGANPNGGQVGFLAQANQTVNPSIGQPLSATGTQTDVKCFGGNTGAASVSSSGGAAPYTYTWLPAGGNSSSATGLSAGIYSCMVQSSNLCTTVKTFTITQPTALTLNTSASSTSACVNKTITLTGVASGGTPAYNYTWSPGVQANPYTFTQASSGSYVHTVTAKDLNNCLSTQTIQVIFVTPPAIAVTNASICSTNTAVLTASGAASFTWFPGGIPTATYAASPAASSVYTVFATAGSCTTSATASITIQNVSLTISASTTSVCAGDSIVLTANCSGGTLPYSYTWTNGPTVVSYTIAPATAGNYLYSVNGTDINNCTATGNILVTVLNSLQVSVGSITVCAGTATLLTASGANSYTWLPSGFSGTTYTLLPFASSSHTILGSILGCTASTTASVLVKPSPGAAISCTHLICSGQPLNLYGSGNGTYSWTGPGGFNSLLQNAVANPVYPVGSGAYSLVVTSANGCTSSTFAPVSVLPLPIPAVTGAGACAGETVTLSASGGTSYQWSGPGGFVSGSPNPVILVSAASMGNYTVVVTANTCTSQAMAQVTTNPLALPIVSISGNTRGCLYTHIVLQGSGGTSYEWTGPNNYYSIFPDLNLDASSLSASGIYTLSVKNASNCASSGTVQITVDPLPGGLITSDIDKHCVPFCSTFSLTPSPMNASPVVNSGFLAGNGSFFNSNTICFQKPGTYTVTAFFTDGNGCTGQSSLTIDAYPLPGADFEFSPEKPVEGPEPVQFMNTSTGAQLTQWSWFFNTNESETAFTGNTSHVYDTAGSFPIAMIVTNAWGCSDTAIKYIDVSPDYSLYVPNAFTPDGDHLNDIFQPKGIGIAAYQLDIFDRWGEHLFSSSNFYKGWNGTYKGTLCKMDTYLWKITTKDASGKIRNYSGHVSLLK